LSVSQLILAFPAVISTIKKSNKDFVKKILSTEKHYWANKQIYKRMNIVWFLGKMYYL